MFSTSHILIDAIRNKNEKCNYLRNYQKTTILARAASTFRIDKSLILTISRSKKLPNSFSAVCIQVDNGTGICVSI